MKFNEEGDKDLYRAIAPKVRGLCNQLKMDQLSNDKNLLKNQRRNAMSGEETQKEISTSELKQALVNKMMFEAKEEIQKNIEERLQEDRKRVTAEVSTHWKQHFESEVKLMSKQEVEDALAGNIKEAVQAVNDFEAINASENSGTETLADSAGEEPGYDRPVF